MYKRASQRTGGSQLNGRARVAAPPNNARLERLAAHSDFARRLILVFGFNGTKLATFGDQDLVFLIDKLIEEQYTKHRSLVNLRQRIGNRVERKVNDFALLPKERLTAESELNQLLKRWQKYRSQGS